MIEKGFLIETFSLHRGRIRNAPFHAARMLATGTALGFIPPTWEEVESFVAPIVSDEPLRCTLTYRQSLEGVEVVPYRIKYWRALQLIPIDYNIYPWKWKDRHVFSLYDSMMEVGTLPLFVWNECLTDTVYTHVVLEDMNGDLVTPDTFLIRGTMRESLIQKKIITERRITTADLIRYRRIHLINAMMLPGENKIPMERILFP